VVLGVGDLVDVETGEGVGLGVCLARAVGEREPEAGEVESPTSLSTAEVLCGAPVLEVGMVSDNLEGFRESFQEVAPVLESLDNGQHLPVVDLVVPFGGLHGGGSECNGVPEAVILLLEKGSSSGKAGGVDFNASGAVRIPERQNGGGREGIAEGVKGLLLRIVPLPGDVLLGEVVERSGDGGEVLDETAVKVGEPEETTNGAEVAGDWPVADGFDLGGVHADFALTDDQPEVFDLLTFELALFWP